MTHARLSIITPGLLRANLESPPAFLPGLSSAFCDFAAGGDENVLAIKDGNGVLLAACWRETDTIQAVRQFIAEFKRFSLAPGSISAIGMNPRLSSAHFRTSKKSLCFRPV